MKLAIAITIALMTVAYPYHVTAWMNSTAEWYNMVGATFSPIAGVVFAKVGGFI